MRNDNNTPSFERKDRDGNVIATVTLPWSWAICETCDGHGKTRRHVECDGGGITGSEMAELCHDDPDFIHEYFSGKYDLACDDCKGSGKAKVIKYDLLEPVLRAEIEAESAADAAYEAERWEEKRMRARGYQF